ncbi:hypothetical protein NEOLEDRAFT_1127694 [Neolentinus lepideus HHB14362 ss-1]|uniref:Zn(2)-C6 fungal-type domain-containing protein n=1 Tax=Neolentinus lepideus HHB14362 ss-1 TaxID=1314782 RepID=A0A165VKY1_9AGAM|nr:hypothetical protein NEOLEDRAFT_1127694 [Neolentinus lepideus HHB14362 ss-1]
MSFNVFHVGPPPVQEQSSSSQPSSPEAKKRTHRACDQCRRSRVKCVQLGEQLPCQTCSEGGIVCTISGPRFRTGPPKGYIRALEQRWYQTEAILAVLLSSPNPLAQAVITVLRRDAVAGEVLDRITNGPFGIMGRATLPQESSMQDIVAYATRGHVTQDAKQSRSSREDMSSQTQAMSFGELIQWQDGLSLGFTSSPASLSPYTVYVPRQPANYAQQSTVTTHNPEHEQTFSLSELDMSDMYTTEDQSEDEISES